MSLPSEQVDPTTARLLNELQRQLPLVRRPFAEIGRRVGMDESEVLSRVTELSASPGGIIRQISAIFDSASLGYQSCLVAARVDESRIGEAATVINQHSGVSHNYRRNHEFNLWFTIALPPDSALGLEKTVEILKQLSGAESMHLLPSIKVYKIGVKFDLSGDGEPAARVDYQPRGAEHRKEQFVATESDKTTICALQKNLPLVAKPFEVLARDAGVAQEELLAAAQSYLDRGIMRRFAAVIRHRQAGFGANAMGVWIVPEGEEDKFGATVASFEAVSHCYRRPVYEGWPYSVFTMVHGKTAGDCETVLAEIAKTTKVDQYLSLYSTHEYKKTRVQYFTPANAAWEAAHAGEAVLSSGGMR